MQEEGTYGSVLPQGQSLCVAFNSSLNSAWVFFFGPVFVAICVMMEVRMICLCIVVYELCRLLRIVSVAGLVGRYVEGGGGGGGGGDKGNT
jgi:hypothetical protein